MDFSDCIGWVLENAENIYWLAKATFLVRHETKKEEAADKNAAPENKDKE